MKKIIVLVLFVFFGLGFVGIEKATAQTDIAFKFNVEWDDSNCICGSPIVKTLTWEVWDLTESEEVASGVEEVTGTSHIVDTSGDVEWDCEDCYRVSVYIDYSVGGTSCCSGYKVEVVDGDELLSSNYTISITNMK